MNANLKMDISAMLAFFAKQPPMVQFFVCCIMKEVIRAKGKHPHFATDLIHGAAIVGEESGELLHACINNVYEGSDKDWSEEAIHTAATCIRLMETHYTQEIRAWHFQHEPAFHAVSAPTAISEALAEVNQALENKAPVAPANAQIGINTMSEGWVDDIATPVKQKEIVLNVSSVVPQIDFSNSSSDELQKQVTNKIVNILNSYEKIKSDR